MSINKNGIIENGLWEQDGTVKILKDNISINPNLLSGTRNATNPWILTSASNDGNNTICAGTGIIYVTPGKTYTISCETDGTWTGTHGGSSHIPADKDVSLCIYLRYTGTTKGEGSYDSPLFLGRGYNIICSKNNYKGKVIWKWTAPSNAYTIRIRYNTYSNGTDPITVKLWNLKVEEGNIATPWIPNINDTLYTSLGFGNNTLSKPIESNIFYEI